jgi:hypothetical protein
MRDQRRARTYNAALVSFPVDDSRRGAAEVIDSGDLTASYVDGREHFGYKSMLLVLLIRITWA